MSKKDTTENKTAKSPNSSAPTAKKRKCGGKKLSEQELAQVVGGAETVHLYRK